MNVITRYLLGIVLAPAILLAPAPGSAQPQQVAYPEVKVVLENHYKPDSAFDKMNGAFLDAVQRKDVGALTTVVAPTFLWTVAPTRPTNSISAATPFTISRWRSGSARSARMSTAGSTTVPTGRS